MNKNNLHACIATNRFGLGARPGEISAATTDPKGWLLHQLKPPTLTDGLSSSDDAIRQMVLYNAQRKAMKENAAKGDDMMAEDMKKQLHPMRIYTELCTDAISHAIETESSLSVRLLDFFSNHFSVSTSSTIMRGLAPTLEREAIAPHLTGRFEQMLLAVTQHPAMLIYLNNEQSFGPNSRIAQRRKQKGLNENLAREILELHTLGVNGGYTQTDVIELAKALTGWSVAKPSKNSDDTGFFFRTNGHEPGDRQVLGVKYRSAGKKQAEKILKDLAVHPSTARFISEKIARHFISDEPPASLVSKLEKTWLKTGGDLKAVVATLIEADESWQHEPQKLKTPREFVVSAFRATGGAKLRRRALIGVLADLGQRPFDAGSPAGFGDISSDWDGADALYRRVELVARYSKQYRKMDAVALANESLGDMLSDKTALHIKRAESFQQAFTLWSMSPEFLRR